MPSDLEILAQNVAKASQGRALTLLDPAEQAEVQRIKDMAQAQTTQNAYQAAWRDFEEWCEDKGVPALPTDVGIVEAYLHRLQKETVPKSKPPRKYSISTVEQRIAAIKKCHLVAGYPLDLSQLGEYRKGLRSKKADEMERTQKEPLLDSHVIEILRRMSGSLADLRDRVILLLGFVGGMRRAEIAGVDVGHIKFVEGGAEIKLLKSKGDRDKKGVTVNLVQSTRPILCAVQALKDWIAASAVEDGPLLRPIDKFGYVGSYRLTPTSIRRIVIARAAAAGFRSNISTHSLRRGAVTSALKSGASIEKVATHVRHRSIQTTMGYYKQANGMKENAMHAVLDVARADDPPAPVPVKRGDQTQRGLVVDYDEFAQSSSAPIKVNRIELREVDTSGLQQSVADVDALNKRLAEKFGASK
jgi:integrase